MQECDVSFELNSDLVVQHAAVVQTVLNSVTITTQEEAEDIIDHSLSARHAFTLVYKRSVKNEQKVQTLWTDDSSSRCHAKRHSSKDHVCCKLQNSRIFCEH